MIALDYVKREALSKLIKESRPCAAGCGNAKHNRRRDTTSNAIALGVVSWPAVTQKNSKQQCKRYRANKNYSKHA